MVPPTEPFPFGLRQSEWDKKGLAQIFERFLIAKVEQLWREALWGGEPKNG
jgi:hypothetical protein